MEAVLLATNFALECEVIATEAREEAAAMLRGWRNTKDTSHLMPGAEP